MILISTLSIMFISSLCMILYFNSLTALNKKETARRAIQEKFRKRLENVKVLDVSDTELEEAV